MKKRVTEIEIERRETFVINLPPAAARRPVCAICAAAMLLPEEAAAFACVGWRAVFRLIEQNQIHFAETEAGAVYVCAQSFAPENADFAANFETV